MDPLEVMVGEKNTLNDAFVPGACCPVYAIVFTGI
jgi:hypothetical protein